TAASTIIWRWDDARETSRAFRLTTAASGHYIQAMARTFEPLARRLIKAVHDLSQEPPQDWVTLKTAVKAINVSYQELIDGAVSHSRQRGWLEVNASPAKTLRLTHAGRMAVTKQPWQRPGVL